MLSPSVVSRQKGSRMLGIPATPERVLARYGVRCVLLDRKETFNDGSRAICIARPSLQILQRIGAVEPFLANLFSDRY